MPKTSKPTLTLQWHLTRKCDQRCKHCYIYEEKSYQLEKEELPLKDCLKVIDDLVATAKEWKVNKRINFSGGDPLLRDDFFEILKYASRFRLDMNIIGNPFHITPRVAKKLRKLNVGGYQISIDGLEKTHDYFRKPGSFASSIKALKILKKAGLKTSIMFTLSRTNAKELPKVIDLAAKLEIDRFSFNRLVPLGQAENLKKDMLGPLEYRGLLLGVLKRYEYWEKKNVKTKFRRKDPLWSLLYDELGLLKQSKGEDRITGGCSMGSLQLAVLADGTVYPCRRISVPIGKLPKDSIANILINSPFLKEIRKLKNFEKCQNCHLKQVCRGCPAIGWAMTGSHFSADPQCWTSLSK